MEDSGLKTDNETIREVTSVMAKAIAKAGAWAILACVLIGMQLWTTYRRDERDASHVKTLETAVDRFAAAAETTAETMKELKTEISTTRKESDAGHEAVINAVLSELNHRCRERRSKTEVSK